LILGLKLPYWFRASYDLYLVLQLPKNYSAIFGNHDADSMKLLSLHCKQSWEHFERKSVFFSKSDFFKQNTDFNYDINCS